MTSCNFGSWIYLSFQDDNHQALREVEVPLVGYTFHFKMITTRYTLAMDSPSVGYTFHFKMITTLLITIACYIIN